MSPAQPAFCASFARETASAVLSAAIPATSGLPFITRARVLRIATFSSKVSVAASPSEPSATMPSTPLSSCHAAWSPRNAWSTE
jgi:hypothetical protein